MTLIVKTTGKCNFACKFCSSSELSIKHPTCVDSQIKDIIQTIRPSEIILTGGEPLLVRREYFEELLSFNDCYNISLTTNLKSFYLNPDYWQPLLSNERVGVGTSFQFGSERMWDEHTPYDVDMFKRVERLFGERIGYVPSFISLITPENESMAIDHVLLAKELGTKCKLNPLLPLGKSSTYYPKYKMVDIWLRIKELGLSDYFDDEIQFKVGGCGLNTSCLCGSTIRCVYIDESGKVHYSNCEDCLTGEGLEIPMDSGVVSPVREVPSVQESITPKCLFCELNMFCNGCKSARRVAKMDPNYCIEMSRRKNDILKSGWRLS